MAPESLDFTALQRASYRQKNRMVIFAVEINFFTYRGLTHAWTVAIPVCYRSRLSAALHLEHGSILRAFVECRSQRHDVAVAR